MASRRWVKICFSFLLVITLILLSSCSLFRFDPTGDVVKDLVSVKQAVLSEEEPIRIDDSAKVITPNYEIMVKDENVDHAIKHIRNCMLYELEYRNEKFFIDCDFKLKTSWAEGEELEINWREEDE